jgi:O-antigen/teichoic acid export membrane protein
MSPATFGTVLSAQALYGILVILLDNGAAFYGARQVAAGSLDGEHRESLIRVRLQLALAAAAIALAVSVAGGPTMVIAVAPFTVALILFALLNYWEPFGHGDARTISAYLAARSLAPALGAVAVLAIGIRFPPYLAGLLECAAIVVVGGSFAALSLRDARLAVRAPRGPWRGVLHIGMPTLLFTVAIGSGTVLLASFGAAAAAAALAVPVRLLTGLQAVNTVLVIALFPRIARHGRVADLPGRGVASDDAAVKIVLRTMTAIALLALSVVAIGARPLVHLFLGRIDADAESAMIVAVSLAAALAYVAMFMNVLIARHHEGAVLAPVGLGATIVLVAGTGVAAVAPHNAPLLMACVLATGQLATVALLAHQLGARAPGLAKATRACMTMAFGLAGAGLLVVLVPQIQLVTAAALAIGAAILTVAPMGGRTLLSGARG